MADILAESTWTGFTKKHKLELDDAALRKALARFDKTDEAKPQARLDALAELVEQLNKQVVAQARRKKELGDKPFALVKDQLHGLLEEAEKLQRKTHAAAQEGEDEADSPTLLTTKMVPLLRELRKGEAQMHAMICLAGKNTAVLITRRTISPSHRKMLAAAVDATGGMKYIEAECLYEGSVLTFVVKSPGGQLAKRLRQALLDQTELRLKVKIRGEDGVEETDGEDGEGSESGGHEQPEAQQAPQAPSAELLAYTQRRRQLDERLAQALQQQHPESTKLRAVSGFASEKAEAADYGAALKALEMLEKLLDAPTDTATQNAPDTAGAEFKARMAALIPRIKAAQEAGHPAAADIRLKAGEAGLQAGKHDFAHAHALLDEIEAQLSGSGTQAGGAKGKVAFARLKLQWNEAKARLERDLEDLRELVLAEYDDAETAQQAHKILRITGRFNEGLADTLDDLYNAAEPALQQQLRGRAAEIVGNYQAYLDGDALVAHIEENPFMPLEIRGLLSAPLQQLHEQLA